MRRLFRLLKWTFALLLGLPLLAYVALLLINLNDQPPSAEALEMQRLLAERPVPADEDNAQVYMLGLLALDGASPVDLGRRRMDWMASTFEGDWDVRGERPEEPLLPVRSAPASTRLPSAQKLIDGCRPATQPACLPDFAGNTQLLEDWLASERWLLERYRELITRQTTFTPLQALDIRAPFPPYQQVLDGQRLLLVQAWLLARQEQDPAARQLLEDDLSFWRMVQRDADTLIEKMIAVAAIRQHLQGGRAVLQETAGGALPAIWLRPFDDQERALTRTFAVEWHYANSILKMMESDAGSEQGVMSQLIATLGMPLLQTQAAANTHAAGLLRISTELDVPLSQARKAYSTLQAELQAKQRTFPCIDSPYNPLGQMLENAQSPDLWLNYPLKINDLESIRRASVLLASAAAERIPDQRMAGYVAQHPLRDPYSDEAFGWDTARGMLLVPLLQQAEPLQLPRR